MDRIVQQAKGLRGKIAVPGDKSISHRAVIMGSLARGFSIVDNLAPGKDVQSTICCMRELGVAIEEEDGKVLIQGRGLDGLSPPKSPLDAGNSGTTMRFLSGMLAGQRFSSILTGDDSLIRRPMQRVIKPLTQMGGEIKAREDSFAPLQITGKKLKGIEYQMEIKSAQVKSCILLAGLYAQGKTVVIECGTTRDHTERMMQAMGAPIEAKGEKINIESGSLSGGNITVPGDISSAAFLIAATSILSNSDLTIDNVGINSTRTGLLDALKLMGADFSVVEREPSAGESIAEIRIRSAQLQGIEIGGDLIPRMIDEIPVLAVIATQAQGMTIIHEAEELRVKETDRIAATVSNLKALGAQVEELDDGMKIKGPTKLKGATVKSFDDHRIAMSLAVAGLSAQGETLIEDAQWADISFPGFFETLQEVRVA